MITTCCVLLVNTRGKLDAKEKAAFSFKYLLVYSLRVKSVFDTLYLSGQPASFSCSLQILNEKCVEFSSELNGTLLRFLWWILKELEPTYCPKVWKCCLVHFEYERVNRQLQPLGQLISNLHQPVHSSFYASLKFERILPIYIFIEHSVWIG